MPDIYMFIGARIRAERKLSGLTIEKLAEHAGLTPSFVGLIERGDRKLSVLTLNKLAIALDIQPCELMGRKKDPPSVLEKRVLKFFGSLPAKIKRALLRRYYVAL